MCRGWITKGASVVVLLLLCGFEVVAQSPQRDVLVVESGGVGPVRLSFDPSRIAREELKTLARVSPYDGIALVPPALELCVAGDAQYRPCGTRQLDSPNFLFNADVNVALGRNVVASLDGLHVPDALEPAWTFYHRQASFLLCLEEARLGYYRGDDRALAVTCDSIDARGACSRQVEESQTAHTAVGREQLARFDWHNCMNGAFHRQLGDYPRNAWQMFLTQYGIQETMLRRPD